MSQPPYGPRLLRRSRTDRYIGGVCGGVAAYLNMDATLVRILTVLITLFTGAPVVLYLVALFLLPEEDVAPAPPVGRGTDAVWGPAGPPWEQNQASTPPASTTAPGTTWSPAPAAGSTPSSEPTQPPRREDPGA